MLSLYNGINVLMISFNYGTCRICRWELNCNRHYIDKQEPAISIIRPRLHKRPTNLKIEGNFLHITEYADKFITYLLEKRAKLLRTPTTLKLEGEMNTLTETAENYIKYDIFDRPSLCKKFTHLHLEGELDNNIEKRDKYIPFEVQKRPPLMKKSTNLHMEGDLSLMPEYRQEYIDYGSLERPKPVFPLHHLKPGGVFENMNHEGEHSEKGLHPTIPFLRDSDRKHFEENLSKRTTSRLSQEQSFVRSDDNQSEKLKKSPLHPNIIFTKASDSDISRTSVNVVDLGFRTPRKSKGKRTVQREANVEDNTETGGSSRFDRPDSVSRYAEYSISRSALSSVQQLTNRGDMDGRPDGLSIKDEELCLDGNEKKVQCYNIRNGNKSHQRKSGLGGEGRFECQPEYRKAYIDYLVREKKPPLIPKKRLSEMFDGKEKNESSTNEELSDSSTIAPNPEKSASRGSEIRKCSSTSVSSAAGSPQTGTRSSRSRTPKLKDTSTKSRDAVFGRFLTPSLSPQLETAKRSTLTSRRRSRTPSPNMRGSNSRSVPSINKLFDSTESGSIDDRGSDRAFVVLDDTYQTRRHIRHNLYKEQKWMPSWNYSLE